MMMWIDSRNAKELLAKKARERNVTPFFKEETPRMAMAAEVSLAEEKETINPGAADEAQGRMKSQAKAKGTPVQEPIPYMSEKIDTRASAAEAVRERHKRFGMLRRMNGCTKAGTNWIFSNDRNFYKQAVFMEDFTDHYAGNEPYYAYRPSYADMTDRQLRTYFTWRTGVRQGCFELTSPSYITLYTYELINRIGVKNNADGMDRIFAFWRGFRELDTSIDAKLYRLAKQYYICYETEMSHLEFLRKCPIVKEEGQEEREALFRGEFQNKLQYLNGIAAYKITESRFYPGNEKLLDLCLAYVLKRLDQYYKQHGRVLAEDLAGEMRQGEIWHPFSDAIFLETDTFDRKVVLSKMERYERKDGVWRVTCTSTVNTHGGLIGYLLKTMEAELRRLSRFRYKLSPKLKSAFENGFYSKAVKDFVKQRGYTQAIVAAVDEFYEKANCAVYFTKKEEKERAELQPIQKIAIDTRRFATIRREAEEIEKRLVVEDAESLTADGRETEGEAKSQAADGQEAVREAESQAMDSGMTSPMGAFFAQLTVEERRYLDGLLQEEGEKPAVKFAELLAEAINEKALEAIGDIILEDGKLIPEYEKEIRGDYKCRCQKELLQ